MKTGDSCFSGGVLEVCTDTNFTGRLRCLSVSLFSCIIIIIIFLSSSPATMAISCCFVCKGEERLERFFETRLYVWQGFVAQDPG